MKKILLTAGAMLLWAGLAQAASGDMVRISADDYRTILKRLDALQTRVDSMENQKGQQAAEPSKAKATPATPKSTAEKIDRMADDINNIYDTLDKVETKTVKDRVNFGGELRVRYDSYAYTNLPVITYGAPTSLGNYLITGNDDNNWSNRARINMDANISKSLKFHGRLTTYYIWGDHDTIGTTNIYNGTNTAHLPGDTTLKLDRFYVDWIPQDFPIPLAITVGRHPSTEGPPAEFKENRPRQSTYPAIMFDGENDGIVVTFGLERMTSLKNSGLRFGYGKVYHSDHDNSNTPFLSDGTSDSKLGAAFFETAIPGVNNSLFVLGYARVTDLPSNFDGQATTRPVDIGDEDFFSAHLQAANIAGSGLDIFMSGSMNKTDPNGTTFYNYYYNPTTKTFGLRLDGLMDSGSTIDSHTGWAVLAGFRYKLPIQAMLNPKIGFEFNHGSQFHHSMTSGSNELFSKLSTRGNVYDVYWIQPANRNLFFRTGMIYVDYDYTNTGSIAGKPMKFIDSTHGTDYYFLMDVRF